MAKKSHPAIEVFAINADGEEKRVKAQALRLQLTDGSTLQLFLEHGDTVLVEASDANHAAGGLLFRPQAAHAAALSVESNTLEFGDAATDISVQFAIKPKGTPGKKDLRAWAEAALADGLHASVTLRVVDEEEGRTLNRDYRAKDYATNVLTFVFDDAEQIGGMDGLLLGDIVLCAPVIAREAEQQGKALAAHWAHLVVHGMLHLQGYDHEDEAEAEAMETLEAAILQGLGFANPYAGDEPETAIDEPPAA